MNPEVRQKIAEALNNSTPGIVERDELVRMTEAVVQVVSPLLDQNDHIWVARLQLADQLDEFAEGIHSENETKSWRRGMKAAARMLRSQVASGQVLATG